MKKEDIKSHTVFNNWTVLSFDKELGPYGKFKYYFCRCSCGNECSVRGFDLINGKSKSCGCGKGKKRNDLRETTVNNIFVIKELSHKLWEVKCVCGKIFTAKSHQLQGSKPIQSCGCKTIEIIKSKSSSYNPYLTYLYSFYKNNAVKRGLEYKISLTFFESIIIENCYYCGIEAFNIFEGTSYANKFLHNGIDRKNNSIGYIESNCVPCCKFCNMAKSTMSEKEFYNWINRAHKFIEQNNRLDFLRENNG